MDDLANGPTLIGHRGQRPILSRLRAILERWRTRRDRRVDVGRRPSVEDLALYISAWSTDLGEALNVQRVVVGGVVDGSCRVHWSGLDSRILWVLDDGRGLIQAAVPSWFPEEIALRWAGGKLVVAAGRVVDEHIVAIDRVWTLDEAMEMGPGRFAEAVAASAVYP